MTAELLRIEGEIRDYAWGTPGGISRQLGWEPTQAPQAELWLGAHPSAPSRVISAGSRFRDLAEWEQEGDGNVPYLLKVLSASFPLSLQAHPTPAQAAEGFAQENAAGVPLTARERNYKDPFAKPELIVALEDGFEALCGFRPVAQTRAVVRELAETAPNAAPFAAWESVLAGADPVRSSFEWLLHGGRVVDEVVAGISAVAAADGPRWELAGRLATEHPGDPGIAVALMLNHVVLRAGESLWLPAGNIHAYLRGTGMELMGPSDNVLRGGLTPKHVDKAELGRVLDFSDGDASYLVPIPLGDRAMTYRPRSVASGNGVPFELIAVTGDAQVSTAGPAIGIVVDGSFTVSVEEAPVDLEGGQAVFVTDAATIGIRGAGRLFVATA